MYYNGICDKSYHAETSRREENGGMNRYLLDTTTAFGWGGHASPILYLGGYMLGTIKNKINDINAKIDAQNRSDRWIPGWLKCKSEHEGHALCPQLDRIKALLALIAIFIFLGLHHR